MQADADAVDTVTGTVVAAITAVDACGVLNFPNLICFSCAALLPQRRF